MSQVRKFGVVVPISPEMVSTPMGGRALVTVSKSPEWLIARAEFVAEWDALTKRGLDLEYLEYAPCYECGGEVVPTTNDSDYEFEGGHV